MNVFADAANADLAGLPDGAKLLYLKAVEIAARKRVDGLYDELETWAARLGRSVRTVQSYIRALAIRGLARLERWSSKTGIKLILTALERPAVTRPEPTGNIAPISNGQAQAGADSCAKPAAPSSIEREEEKEREKDDDDKAIPMARHAEPAPPVNPSSSSSAPFAPQPPRKASRAEVDALVERAAPVLGDTPEARSKLVAAARRFRLSWVRQAVEVLVAKHREERLERPWGYLFRTLANWQAEGGPPPEKPSLGPEERVRALEAMQARMGLPPITIEAWRRMGLPAPPHARHEEPRG